jgi:sulfur carrier protein ThiS
MYDMFAPMTVTLEYPAMLRADAPPSGSLIDVPDACDAAALLDLIKISKRHQPSVAVFVNNTRVLHSHKLQANDRVYLALPIGGG